MDLIEIKVNKISKQLTDKANQISSINTKITPASSIITLTNLITNGNMSLNGGYSFTLATGSIDTVNKKAVFTPTAMYGQIKSSSFIPIKGHKYYLSGRIKTTKNTVLLDLVNASTGSNAPIEIYASNSGNFTDISGIGTVNELNQSYVVKLFDAGNSPYSQIECTNFILIDLTYSFGAGYEYTKAQMDALRDANGGYFSTAQVTITSNNINNILKINASGNFDTVDMLTKTQYVEIKPDFCRVQFPYSASESMWVEMTKCLANSIFNFSKFYKGSASCDGRFDLASQIASLGTDMIAPIVVNAVNNKNGDNPAGGNFTGGNHAYNGDSTGTPTARNISTTIYVDGNLVTNYKGYADTVLIVNVERIQAGNTVKSDGSGREVLEQTITYLFKSGKCEVFVDLKALEDISILTYYGLQTSNISPWNQDIMYIYGDSLVRKPYNTSNNCGVKSSYPNVDRYVLRGSTGDAIIAWIDNSIGLGQRNNVGTGQPLAFTASYAKTYFNLVTSDVPLSVSSGNSVYFHGGYAFVKGIQTGSSTDIATQILKNGQIWNLVDFIAAGTEVLGAKVDEMFKVNNTPIELKKDAGVTGVTSNNIKTYTITATLNGSYWFRF